MAETKATNGHKDEPLTGKAVGRFVTPDQILSAQDLKTEVVEVKEWGGNVTVQELTAEARDAYEASLRNIRRDGTVVPVQENLRAKLVVQCLVHPDGSRMFSDDQMEALARKSGSILDRLFDVAARLSGLEDQDVTAEGKGSEQSPASVSS